MLEDQEGSVNPEKLGNEGIYAKYNVGIITIILPM
jgi:hypothetical protein